MFHHKKMKFTLTTIKLNSLLHARTTKLSSSRLHQPHLSHLNSKPPKPPKTKKRHSSTSWSRNQKNMDTDQLQKPLLHPHQASQRFTSSSTRLNRQEVVHQEDSEDLMEVQDSEVHQEAVSEVHQAAVSLVVLLILALLQPTLSQHTAHPENKHVIQRALVHNTFKLLCMNDPLYTSSHRLKIIEK